MGRLVVFAGPTITADQIRVFVPSAEVLPPIAAGDLIRLALSPGDLVAIVDGFYFQSASVRHKEILMVLSQGIHVWGASSMGALRAAELAPFGMKGFGRIFEAYVQGVIEGDDEVAVLHAPQEMGYARLAEALVNMRYACEQAVVSGIISHPAQNLIIQIAAELPFYNRTYQHVLEIARERGLPQQVADEFLLFVREGNFDLKKNDALELLQAMQTPPQEPLKTSFQVNKTKYLPVWDVSEKGIVIDEGHLISYLDMLTAFQLFRDDYPAIHHHLLFQALATIASQALPATHAHDPTPPVRDTIEQAISTVRLEQTEGSFLKDVLTNQIAHYISLQCEISFERELPESASRWLYPEERSLTRAEQLVLIGIRLWHSPLGVDWRGLMIDYLKAREPLSPLVKLVYQVQSFNEALQRRRNGFDVELLSPMRVCEWFAQKWAVARTDMELAVHDRGFKSVPSFLELARPFYLFDKYVGVALVRESGEGALERRKLPRGENGLRRTREGHAHTGVQR